MHRTKRTELCAEGISNGTERRDVSSFRTFQEALANVRPGKERYLGEHHPWRCSVTGDSGSGRLVNPSVSFYDAIRDFRCFKYFPRLKILGAIVPEVV